MKLVIFGVIAFVVGIGGSTGALVLTAPKLPAGADTLLAAAAESTAVHAPGGEHGAAPHATPAAATATGETAATPAGEAAAVQTTAEPGAVVPAASASGAHGVEAATVSNAPVVEPAHVPALQPLRTLPQAPDEETFKQVGSILMNMKPAEAAKIMSYLNDSQVEGLLRSMSPRNAATVLSQLPAERAAALSRRLLVPAPKEARP